MAEEDRRRELVSRYANVKNQIMEAISRSSADPFFRSSLEDLQKTVRSMEPMVKDMVLSEIESSRHTFMINMFLPLLIQVEDCIRQFLGIERPAPLSKVGTFAASIYLWLGIELSASSMPAISLKKDLEIIRGRLKYLYKEYVNEELNKLALLTPAVADEVVMTEKLLRYLLSTIRNEAFRPWSNPVFEKIKIILESLEIGFYSSRQQQSSESSTGGADNFSQPPIDMPRLLRLLKEVKLLLRFLNGDHGLDILYRLQQREYALRGFVTDAVKSQLYESEWRHLNLHRWKVIFFMILSLELGVLAFAKEFDNPKFPNSPSEFAGMIIIAIAIFLLAYCLAMQISTHFRLRQSHAQRHSSNSNNSRCGWFQLVIFAAVVVVAFLVIVMVVPTDEPKKYDIFLNFRGSKEIRYTVAGVFHTSLEKANISTFFDERNSRKTKRFLDEIESAISNSVGAITIFSEHYGESEYCLDELLLILEREKTYKGYMIRPIFYDVEPDDLTDPESKFGQGLQKHYRTQRKDKVEEWKKALDTVTLIGGDVHKSAHQHLDELVYKVVADFKIQLGNRRGTEDNTILRWRSLIMKVTQPFTLQLRRVIDMLQQLA